MTQKEFYTFDEIKDRFLGVKGTPYRNIYEQEILKAAQAHKEYAIKK